MLKHIPILLGLLLLLACENASPPAVMAPDVDPGDLETRALVPNTWATKAPIPSARTFAVAGAMNNIIYVVGGKDPSNRAVNTVRAYTIATNSWSLKAPLPGNRSSANGVTPLGGRLYVTGGMNNTSGGTRTVYAYNPSTNVWVQRASLPAKGACGAQGAIAGLLYVYAGAASFNCNSVRGFYRYNPSTNSWTTLPSPPSAHESPIGGVISGKFYLVGTAADHSTSPAILAHNVYNPATNSWSSRAPLPSAQENAAGAALGGRLYVAGGTFLSGFSDRLTGTLRSYNPATNTWTTRAAMLTPRSAATGTNGGGLLWVISGFELGGRSTKNEAYTP